MTQQQVQEIIDLDEQEDLEYFARYLGVEYEDLKSFTEDKDIDFDDWSSWFLKWKFVMLNWMKEAVKLLSPH